MSQPLMQFKSHIEGKNADVTIWPDRIEWEKQGILGSGGKLALGAATGGISLLKTGVSGKTKGAEMIPMKAVSSVTTKRDGLRFTAVSVIASGNTVDFRVGHDEAGKIKALLTQLILGHHPSQQAPAAPGPAVSTPPPPPMRPGLAPPPPGTPADWLPDPSGRFAHRYWDGSRWTEHVHDGASQGLDQP